VESNVRVEDEHGVRRVDVVELMGICDVLGLDASEFVRQLSPSVITSKPANGYQVKTGHRTSVRDKSFYSSQLSTSKDVLVPGACKVSGE